MFVSSIYLHLVKVRDFARDLYRNV